jgi:hypothetical protein
VALAVLAGTPRGGRALEEAGDAGAGQRPTAPSWIGVTASLGVPTGLGCGVALRPARWFRHGAGLEHNTQAPGFHGEATVIPFRGRFRPTLGLLAGRGFHADARRFASRLGVAAADADLLRGVDYSWAAVQVGVEIGAERGLNAFAGLGMGLAWGRLRHFEDRFQVHNPGLSVRASDPRLRLTFPSLTLGITYWR